MTTDKYPYIFSGSKNDLHDYFFSKIDINGSFPLDKVYLITFYCILYLPFPTLVQLILFMASKKCLEGSY